MTKKITKSVKETQTISSIKNTYIKVPALGAIAFLVLLVATSFSAGLLLIKDKTGDTKKNSDTPATSENVFDGEKSDKPELKFFVMSFCPYGNQIEDVLRPVSELLGDKANVKPQYIFEKINGNLADYCKNQTGDPAQCATYVKNSNGQIKDVAACKELIANDIKTCNNESSYLKIGNNLYTSLHGRQEATQDVREICAWNLTEGNRKGWWDFVMNVNKNCSAQNADSCWEEQAKSAGLDTAKITECFNTQAGDLIEKEIALTTEKKVQGSPTVIINGSVFPPEAAYTQDGTGTVQVGKTVIKQADFRTPNGIKEAVCSLFNKTPKECSETLEAIAAAGTAPAAGGCN